MTEGRSAARLRVAAARCDAFTLTASLSERCLSSAEEKRERWRRSTVSCLVLAGRAQETRLLRHGGRRLRLAGRPSPPSPPCAAQPMLLTRGLKVESFPVSPPPTRPLLQNHLHPRHDNHHKPSSPFIKTGVWPARKNKNQQQKNE